MNLNERLMRGIALADKRGHAHMVELFRKLLQRRNNDRVVPFGGHRDRDDSSNSACDATST